MKLTGLFALILLFAVICFAQEQTDGKNEIKWTRIETKDKDLSVSLPNGFLVDAEPKEGGQKTRIIGFQNGFVMELTIYEAGNSKERLDWVHPGERDKVTAFRSNGFDGKNIVSNEDGFSSSIYLAWEKKFYRLFVRGENEQSPQVTRFLYSIKLNGQPLFVQKTPKVDSAEEIVSVSSLKTSDEVLAALKRKSEDVKISYVLNSAKNKTPEDKTKYSRPPIILYQPRPEPDRNAIPRKQFADDKPQAISFRCRLTLLANGQIGEITVLSSFPEYVTEIYKRNVMNSVRQIRFVPAQINGKNVDSQTETQTRFVLF